MLASNVEIIQPKKKQSGADELLRRAIRVAGYARVSTGRPEQKTSFESQQKHYHELIGRHPEWVDVGLYADEGITATSMRKRKNFLRMLQDCRDGKIDKIIVKSVSRFARNTVDCLATIEELTALNVDVYFELQNLSSLQDSKTTRLQLTMYASMAQEESETLSESVAYGIREGIKNGRYRQPRAYGYSYDKENKRLHIIDEEAEVIRRIFNYFLQGMTVGQIAYELNKQQITPPKGNGWYESTITNILRNEKYIGNLVLQKTVSTDLKLRRRVPNQGEQFRVVDNHAAIISKEMFERVQREFIYRDSLRGYGITGKAAYTSQYAFSNKMFCGHCGGKYRRHRYEKKNKKTGELEHVFTWVCINHKLNGNEACPQTQVKEKSVEAAFVAALNTLIEDKDGFIETVIENITEVLNTRLSESATEGDRAAYAALQKDLQVLLTTSLRSPTAESAREYERLVKEMEELKYKIERDEKDRLNTKMSLERIRELKEFLAGARVFREFDTMVFKKVCERVIVYEDSVTFKFTEDLERTVPLIE